MTVEGSHHPSGGGRHAFARRMLTRIGFRAQIILRRLTQRWDHRHPKSVGAERIAEDFDVFNVELSIEKMASIATLDTRTRGFVDHRDPKMMKMLGIESSTM